MSVADEIHKLHQALEAGALTQEEFAVQKARFLAAPAPLTAEQRREQVTQASSQDLGVFKYVVPVKTSILWHPAMQTGRHARLWC